MSHRVCVVVGTGCDVVDDYFSELEEGGQPYVYPELLEADVLKREFASEAECTAYKRGYIDREDNYGYSFLTEKEAARLEMEQQRECAVVNVPGGAVTIDYHTGVVLYPDMDMTDVADAYDVYTIIKFDIDAYLKAGGKLQDVYTEGVLQPIRKDYEVIEGVQ